MSFSSAGIAKSNNLLFMLQAGNVSKISARNGFLAVIFYSLLSADFLFAAYLRPD
jgi:hypothetical protein